jgi:hypothetical protein
MKIRDWRRALPFLMLLALLIPLFLSAPIPGTYAQPPYVDVWTNKGGQGIGNLNGGRYNIGESITFYCSVNINVDSLRIRAIWYATAGFELTLLERGPSPAGTYQASYSVRGGDVGMWKVICEARSGGQSLSDEVLFGVPFPSPVDVWTNKGGQGNMNPDGGQYTIGESITIYCEVRNPASVLRIELIRPDGSKVVVLNRYDVQAGTYSVTGTVGEPTGVRIVRCWAIFDDVASNDDVGFNVQRNATATVAVTVTVYTTTTRTVTSTLHATATTETTVYTTVYQTTSSTSTRTWYTTVTRTATTTVISWTTVTTTVLG